MMNRLLWAMVMAAVFNVLAGRVVPDPAGACGTYPPPCHTPTPEATATPEPTATPEATATATMAPTETPTPFVPTATPPPTYRTPIPQPEEPPPVYATDVPIATATSVPADGDHIKPPRTGTGGLR